MIGGALVALTGPGVAVFVEAGFIIAAFVAALFVKPPESLRYQLRLRSIFSGVSEGVKYVVGEPVFLSLFILAAIPSLFIYPFVTALMPVYAAEVFHVGPQGLGFLLSALGAGATVGTAVLASLGDVGGKGRLVLISMLGAGMACVAFSRLPWYGASLATLVVLGAAIMVVFATTSAIIQGITPDRYRGRVAGLYMMTWGILPLGSIVSGVMAQRFGAPLATLSAGIALFVAVIVVRLSFPRLSNVR
jgi:MFS family permease